MGAVEAVGVSSRERSERLRTRARQGEGAEPVGFEPSGLTWSSSFLPPHSARPSRMGRSPTADDPRRLHLGFLTQSQETRPSGPITLRSHSGFRRCRPESQTMGPPFSASETGLSHPVPWVFSGPGAVHWPCGQPRSGVPAAVHCTVRGTCDR